VERRLVEGNKRGSAALKRSRVLIPSRCDRDPVIPSLITCDQFEITPGPLFCFLCLLYLAVLPFFPQSLTSHSLTKTKSISNGPYQGALPLRRPSAVLISLSTANRSQIHWWQGPSQAARCQGRPQVCTLYRWCQEASQVMRLDK
jgi:hypothetical protein